MHERLSSRGCFLVWVLLIGSCAPLQARANAAPTNSDAATAGTEQDGSHDFDFEIGTWKTHLKRLAKPLTGSNQWIECAGVSVVRKVWDGRANLLELEADCPSGHLAA